MLYLTGGSTNGVIHLLAIANTAKIYLKLEDISVILNTRPQFYNVMFGLYNLGCTRVLLKYLIEENILKLFQVQLSQKYSLY
jgi:dihydroxyacid dehydratase/phosphogluconate dehydratase